MNKPRIGVTLCIDRGKRWRPGHDYLYVHRAYARRLHEAGATPLLLCADCPAQECWRACDAIVITGGDDLPPDTETLSAWTCVQDGSTEPADTLGAAEDIERIRWERQLLELAAAAGRPLLGICYGMQLMNLHFGGRLYRDVRSEHPNAVDHGGSGRVTHHGATRKGDSGLLNALPQRITLNSSHRQAVAQVAPGFSVTAEADDGVIEAIERERMFGVEWHPETDELGAPLFARFVELVRAG